MDERIYSTCEQNIIDPLYAADVVAGYGEMEILRGVSVRLHSGEIVVIIGPNGAGKSTFLKAVCGLLRVRRGRVLLHGRDITNDPTAARLKAGLAYVPQARGTFTNMTVTENLNMGAFIKKGDLCRTLEETCSYFSPLKTRLKQLAGTMSGGEQRMVAVARALMAKPSVLLLDEPSAELAPVIVDSLFKSIQEIAASGIAVLMVEQNVKKSLAMGDRAYVLVDGENRMEGRARAVLDDPELRRLYMGEMSKREMQ